MLELPHFPSEAVSKCVCGFGRVKVHIHLPPCAVLPSVSGQPKDQERPAFLVCPPARSVLSQG